MTSLYKNVDLAQLVPELKSWNGGKGVDIGTWISCEGNHKHLIGYAQILWPDFVEHDGCIFLGRSLDEDNYRAWLAQTKGDKKRVEAVINHRHIVDIFSRSRHDFPTKEVVLYIGRLIKEIWQTKLSHDFPGRKITVAFPEDVLNDVLEYQITFFQER